MQFDLTAQPFKISLIPRIHLVLIRFVALLMATPSEILDKELRLEEDVDLNLTYVGPAQTTKPVGVNSLRQLGHLHPGGRQVQGQDLSGHSRQPSRVRSIYHQSKGHGQVPGELPKLLPRDGECQGTEEDGEPAGETG